MKFWFGISLEATATWPQLENTVVRSRTLTSAETKYAPIELELQAIAYATRKCHTFQAGTTFKLFTDHRPLISIRNKRKLDDVSNSRILRSVLKIWTTILLWNTSLARIIKRRTPFHAIRLIAQMKATKHMVNCKPFSFKCAANHRLKRPIAPFDSNASETQPKMTKNTNY